MNASRRRVVGTTLAIPLLGSLASLGATPQDEEPYTDADAAWAWMEKAEGLGAATGGYNVGKFPDRMYFTRGTIGWMPNAGQKGPPAVEVPIGFVTDLASIPRPFWAFLSPDGRYAYSAMIHDYLYWVQSRPRAEADEIFALSMADFKVPRPTITLIRAAVRGPGGQRAWDNNARLRASGEKRVMRLLPEHATIEWSEWKKRPGVFGTL